MIVRLVNHVSTGNPATRIGSAMTLFGTLINDDLFSFVDGSSLAPNLVFDLRNQNIANNTHRFNVRNVTNALDATFVGTLFYQIEFIEKL
jgi:hypothetical protein